MDALTRRKFLIASGVVGGAGLAAGAAGIGIADLLRKAKEPSKGPSAWLGAPGRKVSKVVLVTLYGGNDGLNMVIPYADPAYHAARPELAYSPEQVLHLDDRLGLNPVLSGLKRIWDDKQLAIVLGVGYPKPDRSHFRSMDIWQTASPNGPADSGWIGRWLDGTGAPVEAAVSFEQVLPPLLVGRRRFGACVSYRGLSLPNWISVDTVAALGRPAPGDSAMQARAAEANADLIKLGKVVREAEDAGAGNDEATQAGTQATGTGGGNALATQLTLVAKCVESGVPAAVYSVSLGGFDTHADERTGQESQLRLLDSALSGFVSRIARSEAGRQVVVVVYSEFGRRVRANASDGTDHGTAGPVLVLGPRVVGGFYGEQPSLTDLDDGDLKATMDFRDIYAAVMDSVLDADPVRYLDGYQGRPLPVFPTG
jgi:uncharacterized protein (DUF1501 family)